MGRKRNSFDRDFFNFDVNKNQSVCKTCGSTFEGNHVTNLRRHMLQRHKELYEQETENVEMQGDNKKIKKIVVQLSQEDVKDACIKFVTEQSLPLSFFASNAFKTLTGQIFKGLDMTPVSSTNIITHLNDEYTKLKTKITGVLKGKMVSLKIDSATRHDRAVLGINVQFIQNRNVVIYTLATREIYCRQTAENLKAIIENVLEDFSIFAQQIYTITTDNGRNMIKAVDLFNVQSEENSDEENVCDFLEIENAAASYRSENLNVFSVKCAAHTLQLAAKDFLRNDAYSGVINHARQVVKTLRTPNLKLTLEMLTLGKPILDVPTRWSSTFLMLQRLLQYKDVCEEHLKSPLKEEEWDTIDQLVVILKPIHEATLKLQAEQLVLGDFYRVWLSLKIELQAMDSERALAFLNCLLIREPQLTNTEVMNAALYLDPRLRRTLSAGKKDIARIHLKKLASQMISFQKLNTSSPKCTEAPTLPDFLIDESTTTSCTSLIRDTLRSMEVESSSESEDGANDNLKKAFEQIDNYKEKRIEITVNLLSYWNGKKYSLPILAKLAHIVHAVPATQVSVERAFSALKIVLSDLRYNLAEETLQAIMFIKLNSD